MTSGGARTAQTAAGELAAMAAELLKIMAVFKYTNSQTGLATVSVS